MTYGIQENAGETALVTGATGFVGLEVVHTLLARYGDLRVVALLRAADDITLAQRHRRLVETLPAALRERLTVVRGDVAAPRLGLDDATHRALVASVDRVLHCAASTRFDLDLATARRENVEGTRSVLALCREIRQRGGRGRLDHVSTAFVAGRRVGAVGEEELCDRAGFRNTYERTKFEAESLCRAARDEIPVVILRPSIVVGRRSSGATTSYKAAYGPMRMLINLYDLWPALLTRVLPLPLRPDVLVDLVPVDWVAQAIGALWRSDAAVGRCYHLAAGPDAAASVRTLADLTCDVFDVPHLRFVSPGALSHAIGRAGYPVLRAVAPKVAALVGITFSYGLSMPTFDTTNTRAAGIDPPAVAEYYARIVDFAARGHFGRTRKPPTVATGWATVTPPGAPSATPRHPSSPHR